MSQAKVKPETIDAILPQTQCGLCSYDGCKPYAEAIAHQNETLNLCPPGGVEGMKALGKLMEQDVSPFIDDMELKQKPPVIAVIREAECIGCTKCIQACPVDAIIGTGKWMHSIITDQCTGCELCIAPCPVDCIDMIETQPFENLSPNQTQQKKENMREQYRHRYQDRNKRLARLAIEDATQKVVSKNTPEHAAQKKQAILDALKRKKK